ncbi:subtilisin family serine protease [Conyzicola lurida]|uniref:Subtilisin family serine protease n=1 Tax=Conyzicola lurida TaxID=1172621 RepID=A0A841AN94_9MICO|nr:S8 family serine peptidase [Conyzicola lurida]MBB5843186.1 subtilisin family serine protease [Conyzicola lurida]
MSLYPVKARLTACLAVGAVVSFGILVPTAAQAAEATKPAPVVEIVRGDVMNYAVNVTRANNGQTKKVERAVVAAGGHVIASYPQIGVVIAQSDNTLFREGLAGQQGVESVGATRTAPVAPTDPTYGIVEPVATTDSLQRRAAVTKDEGVEGHREVVPDPSESLQWDMAAIGADQAHQITDGDKKVLVAVLDSGIEATHPDLAANVDQSKSAGCLSGVADGSYESWQPTTSSHGTHVAGTIAAARNGVGIAGVAPAVRVSAVKVVSDDGFIYPEAAICGFMFAEASGADITNNSYYIDPWQFWCDSDPDQRAVKTAVDRAVQYTQQKGVLNVAAAGNSAMDLANKVEDDSSPNDTVPVVRPIDAGCTDIPAELDGVVTVSSTTSTGALSSFSNYGLGVIDIAAPGSAILSTVLNGGYGTSSGTSMASPHVAGVAALLQSTHRRATGSQLADLLYAQANDVACPAGVTACAGTPADNGYFGAGLVDALEAVQR